MSLSERFVEESPDYKCPECDFTLYIPVAEMDVTVLGLYSDSRFPGRCLLALKEHCEDLVDLSTQTVVRMYEDVRRAAAAIRKTTGAQRINYAVLGNVEPHLHFHLIPRAADSDPLPGQPPWNGTLEDEPLTATAIDELVNSLLTFLEAH